MTTRPVGRPSIITDVVWTPSQAVVKKSRLRRFMDELGVRDLADLVKRAADDPAWFWDATVKDLGIDFLTPYAQVLDTSDGIAWARWFRGAEMNIITSCLDRYRGAAQGSKAAIIWEGEGGEVRRVSYAELDEQVGRLASALVHLGITRGDRVAVFMPLTPETATAVLAIAKLGAVLVPVFSGYGAEAVASRIQDAEASMLICADAYYRRGTVVPMKPIADEALASCPSVSNVIVYARVGLGVAMAAGRDHDWDTLLSSGNADCPTVALDPEDPIMIIYTSGTSGKPKGTVHVHGGFPVKGAQDMAHCFDVQADDVIFWYTDIGWMMGPWLIYGSLILGATMVLYDGTPDTPDAGRLWQMVARHGVTVMGLSPTLARSLMVHGDQHIENRDLSSLRVLGSTGEMWDLESWRWVFEKIGHGRVPILNYSGGTELSGGILGGSVLSPLRPASFAGPIPGMAADVVDEAGNSLRGAVGELVVRGPNPGMTRGFWRDRSRYLSAYWNRIPGVWVHGDWAFVDDRDGLWYVLGRSDDTLKVAGKRIGPGEVESILGEHREVLASAVFGIPDPLKGEAIVCLVVLAPGATDVTAELSQHVATALGKPLRPKLIVSVPDLPRTRNAKILRRAARAAFLQSDLGDLSSIENPASLTAIAAQGAKLAPPQVTGLPAPGSS